MNKSPQLKPLSNPELSSFSSQLSLILRSGISALEGISIMLEDASSEEEKAILNALSGSVKKPEHWTMSWPPSATTMPVKIPLPEQSGALSLIQ